MYRFVSFNEHTQKTRFRDSNLEQSKGFKTMGKMTMVEYEFLLQVLGERFDEGRITQMQYARYFNEVVNFVSRLKRVPII